MDNLVSELEVTLRKLVPLDLHFLYINLVFRKYIQHNPSVMTDDIKIGQIIWVAKNNSESIEAVILEILDKRESSAIPPIETEWIDPKNERLCVFLWLSLLNVYPPEEAAWLDRWGGKMTNYQIHLMPMKPSSAASCLRLFLDFLYVFHRTLDVKLDLLNEFRNEWERVSKFKHKMLKALEINDNQVTRWFWAYSFKSLGNRIYSLDFDTFKEKLPFVQALYDISGLTDSDKIIALNKTYSAFHAKKFKEKPINLKGANFWLGPEQIRMLNEIASKKKLSEKDALHSLVNDAYLKLIK